MLDLKTGKKLCLVRFQPQQWIYDYAIDSDPAFDIDVTERILKMGCDKALLIRDCRDEADNLVEGLYHHQGPFGFTASKQSENSLGKHDLAD